MRTRALEPCDVKKMVGSEGLPNPTTCVTQWSYGVIQLACASGCVNQWEFYPAACASSPDCGWL